MSEHDQQVAVIDYCEAQGIPVFAIPNGGLRSKRTAAMLKAEGVKPGVPDLFMPLPRGEYAGLETFPRVRGAPASCKGRIAASMGELPVALPSLELEVLDELEDADGDGDGGGD